MTQTENEDQDKTGHDFNKLSGETSLHGIRFIGNRDIAMVRRLIWSVLVLSAISLLTYAVYKSITKYYEYNVTSSISIKQNTIVNFPAVTFCNYNQFRKSLMTDKEEYFFGNVHQSTFNFTPYNEVNFTEVLMNVSHKVEDMLLGCTWQYMPCGPENFTTNLNDFGVCYTFNGNEKNPLTVTNVGYLSGLRLQIDINQSDYTFNSAIDAAGIRMHIHGQDEYPLVYTFGFSVAPGTNTHVSLTGLQVENLKHPYKTNCTNKSLKYSKTYTVPQCMNECKYEYVADKCGCKHPTMMGDVPDCRIEDAVHCAYYYESVFFGDHERTCDCPIACNQTFYEKRLSSASWPTRYRVKTFQEEFNYTMEHIRDSLLEVDIYFEDINFQVIREVPNYSRIQLLSEIGGNMGLLCGMSIITIIEFLEFGLIAAILRFCRYVNNNKVDNKPSQTH